MTPRERAVEFLRLSWYGGDDSVSQEKIAFENNYLLGVVTEAITADRQALQSEILQRIYSQPIGHKFFKDGLHTAAAIISSVFAQ